MGIIASGYIDRYNRMLTKLTSSKGENLEDIGPELAAMLALEVDRPEWKHLAEEELYGAGPVIPAQGVGNKGGVKVRAGAGMLCVVEAVEIVPNAAGQTYTFWVGGQFPNLATPILTGGRDSRNPNGGKQSAALITAGTAINPGSSLMYNYVSKGANESELVNINPVAILANSNDLIVICQTTNVAWNANIFYRERALSPSEQQ